MATRKTKKSTLPTVEVPEGMWGNIRDRARELATNPEQLVRDYIMRGLGQFYPRLREQMYAAAMGDTRYWQLVAIAEQKGHRHLHEFLDYVIKRVEERNGKAELTDAIKIKHNYSSLEESPDG